MSFYRQLFPPIVPAKADAYDGTEVFKFYFQLSISNSRDQILHAQVTAHYLDSNENALDTNTYPLGIVFYNNAAIKYDSLLKMYYVEFPSDLLTLDKFYKIQVRLGTQTIDGVTINYQWLNDTTEVSKMSEWSNVCIVKPITVPYFDLINFQSKDTNGAYYEPVSDGSGDVNIAQSPSYEFTGIYTPLDAKSNETIKSYEMLLYEDNGTLVESSWNVLDDSDLKTIGQYEKVNIHYMFDHILENGKTYYVKFIVTSKNGFTDSKIYKIKAIYTNVSLTDLTFNIVKNRDSAKIHLEVLGDLSSLGMADQLVIRRSSIRSNYKKWKDIKIFSFATTGAFYFEYDDIFVESGVAYKYALQPVLDGARGAYINTTDTIMDYEYTWLVGATKKQLKFAYNTQITNYAVNVKDTIVETIGSKYPFSVRNANVYYKTFQMTTTVTHFMDVDNAFLGGNVFLDQGEKPDASVNVSSMYNTFYKDSGLSEENNYVIEREFRNKVTEFLYNGSPKLFKSDTEGLILVKLSGITLTPKSELGRLVFDLSCTVTEIGPADFETLEAYGIKE